jgi:hypothetical protein
MHYFHLSMDDTLKCVRPSSTPPAAGVITPRIPRQAHNEDQTTPRVCVSPRVWLCALAGVVLFGKLHVYMVDVPGVTDPRPGPDGNLSDFANTDEKWITDTDIAACGGEIEMKYRGFIDFDQELEHRLRRFVGSPVLPSAATDDAIWRIVGSQWVLRDEVA